jgi:hypothetical protein
VPDQSGAPCPETGQDARTKACDAACQLAVVFMAKTKLGAYAFMDEKDTAAWRAIVEAGRYESYRQVARAITLFLTENYNVDHVVSQNAIPRRDS